MTPLRTLLGFIPFLNRRSDEEEGSDGSAPLRLSATADAVLDETVAGLVLEQLVQRKPAYGDVRALARLACVSKAFARAAWPASVVLERSALCHRTFIDDGSSAEPPAVWWHDRIPIGLTLLTESCVALARELQLTSKPATVLSAARNEDEQRRTKEAAADHVVHNGAELEALALAETAAIPLTRTAGSAAERAYRACVLFCAAIGTAANGTGQHLCLPLLPASKECIDTLLELLPALRALITARFQPPAELHAVLVLALGHAAAALDEALDRSDEVSGLRGAEYKKGVEAEVSEAVHCLRVCFICGGAQPIHNGLDDDDFGHESLLIPESGVTAALRSVRGSVGRALAYMAADTKSDALRNEVALLAQCADVLCDTFVDEAAPAGERGRAARALTELVRKSTDDWLLVEGYFAYSGARELAGKLGGTEIFYHRSPRSRCECECRPLDLHVEAKHLAKIVKEHCEDDDLLEEELDTDDEDMDEDYASEDEAEEACSGTEESDDDVRFNDDVQSYGQWRE